MDKFNEIHISQQNASIRGGRSNVTNIAMMGPTTACIRQKTTAKTTSSLFSYQRSMLRCMSLSPMMMMTMPVKAVSVQARHQSRRADSPTRP